MLESQSFNIAGLTVVCKQEPLDEHGDIPTKIIVAAKSENNDNLLVSEFIRDLVMERYRGDWTAGRAPENSFTFHDVVPTHQIASKEDKPEAVSFSGICKILQQLNQQLPIHLPSHQLRAELERWKADRRTIKGASVG